MSEFKYKKSLVARVSTIYIFMTLISILLVSYIFMNNQIELISDITKYQAKELITTLDGSLRKLSISMSDSATMQSETQPDTIQHIREVLSRVVPAYSLFNLSGDVILSTEDLALPKDHLQNGFKAVSLLRFSGLPYYFQIVEHKNEIHFYIPTAEYGIEDHVIFIPLEMRAINTKFRDLYKLILITVVVISLLHFIFAVIMFKFIVNPIIKLRKATQILSEGNYNYRVDLHRDDELGALCDGFNTMAEVIHEKIETLKEKMKVIKEAKDKIEEMAITDELTGLYNRRYLFEQINIHLQRCYRFDYYMGVVMIDIDFFKKVNDNIGHAAGDRVLSEVASLLKNSNRISDIVARYGGEEMVIVMPGMDLESTYKAAERLRVLTESLKIELDDNFSINVTASMGVSEFKYIRGECDLITSQILLSTADEAMYKAKANGRNRVEKYSTKKE